LRKQRDGSTIPSRPLGFSEEGITTNTKQTQPYDSAVTPDALDQLLRRASSFKLLKPEEEKSLSQAIERGDLAAKERLVNSNLRLVVSIARRYQGHGLSLNDLVQEGMLGLIRATEKFDWRKGYRFSTYATLWIRQSIQRGLDNSGRIIRLPAHVAGKARKVARVRADLVARLEREPELFELADAADMTIDEVAGVVAVDMAVASLDKSATDEPDAATLGELQSDDSPPIEETVHQNLLAEGVHKALGSLPDTERKVVMLRHGLDGLPRTQPQVAKELGLGRREVERIEARALKRLREMDDVVGLKAA
jgi:RNA polymerase primary sigma factor